FGPVVDLGRRAMQLDEIQRVDAEVLETAVDEGLEVRVRVPARDVRRQTTACFRRDDRTRTAPLLQDVANDSFGPAVAVDIRRVDEGRPRFERGKQGLACRVFPDSAPASA